MTAAAVPASPGRSGLPVESAPNRVENVVNCTVEEVVLEWEQAIRSSWLAATHEPSLIEQFLRGLAYDLVGDEAFAASTMTVAGSSVADRTRSAVHDTLASLA